MSCTPKITTKCDLYVPGTKNVWVEKGTGPDDDKAIGVCLLDTMTEDQVIHVVERDDTARLDLLAVTTDARLQEIARTVARLPTTEPADALQHEINRPNKPESLPFYAIFRGQPPFAQ